MSSMRLFVLAAIASLLAACATPRDRPVAEADSGKVPPYTLERFRDEARIVKGVTTLVIDNPYGEIHVRQTKAEALAWQGVEQRIGEKPRIAQVQPFHDGERQGVRVRYPGIDPDQPANLRQGRVDIYIFVPSGFTVDLKADGAAILVRRINDDVRARSRSGSITVASRGAVDAHSDSGDIRAYTMQALGAKPTRLVTGGNIVADVPLFDDVNLTAHSGGEFRADFALDDQRRDAKGHTQAHWKHGHATKTMELRAGGSVVLQRLNAPVP